MRPIDTYFGEDRLLGVPHPSDYYLIFSDGAADTSVALPDYFIPAIAVNFRVYNATDGRFVKFVYNNPAMNRKLSPYDELVLLEQKFTVLKRKVVGSRPRPIPQPL